MQALLQDVLDTDTDADPTEVLSAYIDRRWRTSPNHRPHAEHSLMGGEPSHAPVIESPWRERLDLEQTGEPYRKPPIPGHQEDPWVLG